MEDKDNTPTEEKEKIATIMVFSGDMDKVIVAFIIATGFAAMGVKVKMWFTLWGANCLKKRRGLLHRWLNPGGGAKYRRLETDTVLQNFVEMMNRGGANHLPLSRLNLFGLGPIIFNWILKLKNIPTVEEFVYMAEDLGVSFTICQICVDALGHDASDLIVANAEVKGVSQYMKDSAQAYYNIIL